LHICCVGIFFVSISILGCIVFLLDEIFGQVQFTAGFSFGTNKNLIFLRIFLAKLVGYFV
jgi:hypothetical protein